MKGSQNGRHEVRSFVLAARCQVKSEDLVKGGMYLSEFANALQQRNCNGHCMLVKDRYVPMSARADEKLQDIVRDHRRVS